jgi:protein transport protein SEC31
MDATFSSKTELEILGVGPQGLQRRAAVASSTRFNRISWGSRLIAAGKEDGDVELWLPDKLLADTGKDALSFSKSQHSGPVKGLHFNTVNTQLLASGSSDGEVFFLLTKIWIWDLAKLDLPYHPGPKSQKLEDITALQWNKQVPHILAAGSTNGYTVLFDLRQKKELLKLPYPGGRRPVTSVAWNPDAVITLNFSRHKSSRLPTTIPIL